MGRPGLLVALASLLTLAASAGGIAAFVLGADRSLPRDQPGDDGFRRFAAQLQTALDRRDLAFLLDRMETIPVVCGPDDLRGLGGPQCQREDERYDGFAIARWRSEGNIVPVTTVVQQLQRLLETQRPEAEDSFGAGGLQVYALDLTDGARHALLTALIDRPANFSGSGPLRVAVGTAWLFQDGRWAFTSLLNAYVAGEEFLIPCEPALEFLGGAWERFPDREAPAPEGADCPFA
jgi:hypothetical protein